MKKAILVSVLGFLVLSCEDVIEVDLPEVEPRLIVNAIFRVDLNEEFVPVEVKVTEASNFFEENTVTSLESALIRYGMPLEGSPDIIQDPPGFSSLAESEPGSGIYIPDPTFDADQRIRTSSLRPGMIFQLFLTHKNRRYFASTSFQFTVPIESLEQGTNTLFSEDDTEIIVTFTDTPDQTDYYVFDFDFGNFLTLDDQFFDGQQFEFSYFYDANMKTRDEAEVSILGADQEFFNYMSLLIEQTEDDGGVFDTPVTTVRGNIFDVTGLDNTNIFDNTNRPDEFALGYFAVIQEFKQTIVIE